MNTHIKLVAVLHLVLGAMGLIGAAVVFAIFGTVGGLAGWHGDAAAASIIGIVALAIAGLIVFLSIPGMVGAWGLLKGKSWARVLMIVIGVLELLHFPLGTALGVYTLWVMFQPAQPVDAYTPET